MTDIKQVVDYGFRSSKTASTSFERYEGGDLMVFMDKHKKPETPADDISE